MPVLGGFAMGTFDTIIFDCPIPCPDTAPG
jgi:hypothetical protein